MATARQIGVDIVANLSGFRSGLLHASRPVHQLNEVAQVTVGDGQPDVEGMTEAEGNARGNALSELPDGTRAGDQVPVGPRPVGCAPCRRRCRPGRQDGRVHRAVRLLRHRWRTAWREGLAVFSLPAEGLADRLSERG